MARPVPWGLRGEPSLMASRAATLLPACIGALAASLNGADASADVSRFRTVAPSSRVPCTSITRGQAVPRETARTLGSVGLVTGSVAVEPALARRLSAVEPVSAAPVRALARRY